MVWVYLDQNKGQWEAVAEMVMSLQLPQKAGTWIWLLC